MTAKYKKFNILVKKQKIRFTNWFEVVWFDCFWISTDPEVRCKPDLLDCVKSNTEIPI